MNLSNRSINMLKTDNITWYKGYVMNERESNFETYFALGTAFASSIESYHKTGDWREQHFAEMMKKEFHIADMSDKYESYLSQLMECIENAKLVCADRCENSEFEAKIVLNDKYTLKSKYDALWDGLIEDYKTVSSFTPLEEAKEKYQQQMEIYQYSEFKRTGEKKAGQITEIKKGRPTLPTKKEELIALLPEGVDQTGTVADIKARLYLRVTPEQISQRISFPRDDTLIERTEDLLRRAMLKADYLQTLQLQDVL